MMMQYHPGGGPAALLSLGSIWTWVLLLVLLLEGLQDTLLWKKNVWTCQKLKRKEKNKSICKAPFNSVIYKQQVIMNFL